MGHQDIVELIVKLKTYVLITNALMAVLVLKIMEAQNVIVCLDIKEVIAKRKTFVTIISALMEEDVSKATYRTTLLFHNVYAVQDIVALIVSKKMQKKGNVVAEDLVHPVAKVYSVLVKSKRWMAKELVAIQAIIVHLV